MFNTINEKITSPITALIAAFNISLGQINIIVGIILAITMSIYYILKCISWYKNHKNNNEPKNK